jgi:hypothetical protein
MERRAIRIKEEDIVRFTLEMASIDWLASTLVFLDEISFDSRDALRRYGYGPAGEVLQAVGDPTRLPRVSALCFATVDGLVEAYMTEGTFTRVKFAKYCDDFARSGHVNAYPGRILVWILDGARIHCDASIVHHLRSMGIIPVVDGSGNS